MGRSSLHAHHLLEGVDHVDQLALGVHDGVDVLVGHRNFIDHAFVLAAFDPARGALLVGHREAALGFGAAHHATRAMAAAIEAFWITLAAHDETARAHRTGDDAQLAFARRYRALARDQDVLAEVALALHIVMVAIDCFHMRLERLLDHAAYGVDQVLHHDFAVDARELLGPADRLDVVIVVLGAFFEVGQVLVRQVDHVAPHVLPRQLDEMGADRIAHAARAGMQHQPDEVFLVQANLDEMVATAFPD